MSIDSRKILLPDRRAESIRAAWRGASMDRRPGLLRRRRCGRWHTSLAEKYHTAPDRPPPRITFTETSTSLMKTADSPSPFTPGCVSPTGVRSHRPVARTELYSHRQRSSVLISITTAGFLTAVCLFALRQTRISRMAIMSKPESTASLRTALTKTAGRSEARPVISATRTIQAPGIPPPGEEP